MDLAPRGIAVFLLHPGYVATDMVGGHGDIQPAQAAERLIALLDRLDPEQTGTFWHSNGSALPW
jgi:NAD(P)-dependent dehydrogenase (short-subunit alcohol dehydrogenase family)